MSFPSLFNFFLFVFHQNLFFFLFSRKDDPAGNRSFQALYLWRQNVMEMVFFLRQGCLKIRQTFRQCNIFLLPPTYLFSGFLSAACLSGQRRHKKKRMFKCGNDFLCVRGCELESHLLVLFSSWLENNSLFLSVSRLLNYLSEDHPLKLCATITWLPHIVANHWFPQQIFHFINGISLF